MRLPTDSTARKLPTAAGSSARSTLVSRQPPFSARFWERLDTVVARRARELLFEVRNSYDRLIWTAYLDGRYPSSSTAPGSADTHFDGVGTRLNAAGANDQDIQSISRHADVSTTRAFYTFCRSVSGLKRALKS